MAPARVKRYIQVGIVDAAQLGDDLRGDAQTLHVDREMLKFATQSGGEHLMRALAHGRRREKRTRGVCIAQSEFLDLPPDRRLQFIRGWRMGGEIAGGL